MKINLKKFGIILLLSSLIFGFLIRLFVILHFADFTGDQINDAYRTMGIWEGSLPTLGPGPAAWSAVSGQGIYLPPLYYYLLFPFTAFTPDLSSQAIATSVFTLLSIPLFSFTVYKLLKNINNDKRIFLSGLAGFWYSILFRNIVFSTGNSIAGNPVPIIFFFLCFILLYTYQLEAKLSPFVEILCWIAYGLVLAVLASLHFSTLFVMPAIFIVSVVFYIYREPKNRKRWFLAGLAILAAILALTPYWIGEISRNWINTQGIISLIINSSSKQGHSVTFLQRINLMARGYLDLGKEVYFIGNSWKSIAISIPFLLTVFVLGVIKFRGNKNIFNWLLFTWIVFLCAYSSTDLDKTYNPVFYKSLIYLAPIFFTIFSLAYLKVSNFSGKILITSLIFCITISMLINLKFHVNYVSGRSGMPRIANTSDLAYVLNQLPEESTLCHPFGYKNIRIYEYIDKYITQRGLQFSPKCKKNNYFIYRKYKSVGNFTMRPRKTLPEFLKKHNRDYTVFNLFKETQLCDIYRFVR
ncbi:MAG: hypothetical protein F6K10_12560 [Moorea sp. SIO2B7]|nr:hypothetical protein [Moorena sp. SIO2B7]